MSETVYLLLGSNIGDRRGYLHSAVLKLEALEGFEVVAVSGVYASPAVEMDPESPGFMNQVVKGEYIYRPLELLRTLEAIERELGRSDKGQMRPRTIDIDILLFGEQLIDTPELSIPHVSLLERPFAMVPLLEIDPDLTHPASGRRIDQFLDDADRGDVTLLEDHVARNI